MIRFGGDQFIVLFDSQHIDVINKRMEKIRHGIEAHFSSQELYLSFSYGIGILDEGVKLALEIADKNMYRQKKSRKLAGR